MDLSPSLAADAVPRQRSLLKRCLVGLFLVCAFAGFVALGTWQVHRLQWKTALIERVESRVHAEPVPAPDRPHWATVSAESHEYRHVRVSGVYLNALSTRVYASTELGNGYWLLTPLRLADGSLVLINRGFLSQASATAPISGDNTPVTVTGLLRISEPGGGYLRRNQPADNRWYSRDVQAIAASRDLPAGDIAPYFIDVDASSVQPLTEPVGGLTVIRFHNNHLMYALTWYALALMTAVCGTWLWRNERKHLRRHDSERMTWC